jgi:hypothetical protein
MVVLRRPCGLLPGTPFERSRWRGGRFACYAPRVMPQRKGSNCGSRTRSFSKYSKTNSLQMSEKIEFLCGVCGYVALGCGFN